MAVLLFANRHLIDPICQCPSASVRSQIATTRAPKMWLARGRAEGDLRPRIDRWAKYKPSFIASVYVAYESLRGRVGWAIDNWPITEADWRGQVVHGQLAGPK